MLKYIIKRIILMPILLVIALLFVFLMVNLSPTDPALQLMPAEYTQEDLDAMHESLGLNDPLIVQYGRYIWNAIHGDLGTSYTTRGSVAEDVAPRLIFSIRLAFLAIALIVVLGVPLGVLCAVKQYTLVDTIINLLCKVFSSIPAFVVGVVLVLLFSVKWDFLPTFGATSWKGYVLPVITLALPQVATFVRTTRSAMLDCIRKDYVKTARSKGATERIVIFRDALKNALLPIITMTGFEFAKLIGGAVVVENVFAFPGVGSRVINAINNKDIPLVLGCIMFLSIISMVMTLVVDLVYTFVDPRVKATITGGKLSKKQLAASQAAQKGVA